MAVRAAATSGAGPHSQPIFHPVVLNVLPPEEIVSVRSAIPGSVASGTCDGAGEHEVLVDLVGDDDQVVIDGQLGDHAPARAASNTLPVGLCGVLSRIIRVRGPTAASQLGRVEAVAAVGLRTQQDGHRPRPGQGDARLVAVVHRLEDDDLVAVVEHPEQRPGERLGGAGGDQHLGVGIVIQPVEALLVAGDGLAQHGHADARRVLVDAAADRLDRRLEHLRPGRRCRGTPARG